MKKAIYWVGLLYARGWRRAAGALLALLWALAGRAEAGHFEALAMHLHRIALPDEARALAERILARHPGSSPALWVAAITAFRAGALEAATGRFAQLDTRKAGGVPVETRLVALALMDPARAARGECYVATLTEVLVDTGYWSVIEGARLYAAETQARTMKNAPLTRGRVSDDNRHAVITLSAPARRIEASCILLGGDGNYAHWVLRNLPKLCLVAGDARPLLVNEDLWPFQRELLELLQIAPERLIGVPRASIVACSELLVPTQLCNHPRMGEGIAWLRERLAPWFGAPAGRRLFASRADAPLRRMENEDALWEALAPLGFERIVPGRMPVREQIRAFSQAAVVVAPHGAALANLAFSPPGTRVLEISNPSTAALADFRSLAACLGQRIDQLVATDLLGAPKSTWQTPFAVDVEAALRAVRALL